MRGWQSLKLWVMLQSLRRIPSIVRLASYTPVPRGVPKQWGDRGQMESMADKRVKSALGQSNRQAKQCPDLRRAGER